jgi:predicted RNase H-like HicB family nuclease
MYIARKSDKEVMSDKYQEYLNKPYHRVFVFDSEDKTGYAYHAFILEFPGCVTDGKSIEDVNKILLRVMESWIDAAISMGQSIPKPLTPIKSSRLWNLVESV